MTNEVKIALLGQPNSGKSTIFNALTGSHQHVGNWPGKTVEKKDGAFVRNDIRYSVTDLPGSYSLSANSDEEIVTRDHIASGGADVVCILADASQLERSMFMLADYAGIQTPAILVLTMTDIAEQRGKKIDTDALSKRLGIPVVCLVATDRKHYDAFYDAIDRAVRSPKPLDAAELIAAYRSGLPDGVFERALRLVPESGIDQYSQAWLASKLIEGDEVVIQKLAVSDASQEILGFACDVQNGSLLTSECKFQWIVALLDSAVQNTKSQSAILTKFDKTAVSKTWGKPLAIGIVLLGLVCSMVIAAPIMGIGSAIPTALSPIVETGLSAIGAPVWLISFICSSLITALGWTLAMLGFVFGINLTFGLIEEVGYMARVSYVFDNLMSKLGLQGKSVMPMLCGFGCTIGGAAGTRVIDSWGQKVLTIALVWAVPCGATWAVVPTLANAFFGWGAVLVMIGLFAVMVLHMAITSKIFGAKLSPKSERTGIIMELPPYHKPKWGALFRQTLNRVWSIFKKAFVVVFGVAAVFWLLSYSASGDPSNSVLYCVGVFIEPVTKFFGMGWQTFLAFVSSMVSKEAALGVLSALFMGTGTIYDSTIGLVSADVNLTQVLVQTISKPEALAFIVAVTFNIPCVMAVASTYQETHSAKWTTRIALYYIATALVLAFLTFHIASLFC